MNMEKIRFEEKYVDEENETTTFYFNAPKEMLKDYIPKKDFPEAVSMEISTEFPSAHIDAQYGYVCMSPTREIEGGTEDYDWYEVNISYNEILELIILAERSEEVKNKIEEYVSNILFLHDMSVGRNENNKKRMDRIVAKCVENLKNHDGLVQLLQNDNQIYYFVRQTILYMSTDSV